DCRLGLSRSWPSKPPKATTRPYSRHILGIYSGVQSHLKATPRPPQSQLLGSTEPPQSHPKATPRLPQGYPKATPKLPQSQVHATYKPGDWVVLRWITLVLPLRYRCSTVVSLVFLRLSSRV